MYEWRDELGVLDSPRQTWNPEPSSQRASTGSIHRVSLYPCLLLGLLGGVTADLSPAQQPTGYLPFPSRRRPRAAWPCAWPWGRPSSSRKCGVSSSTTGSVWTPSARWVASGVGVSTSRDVGKGWRVGSVKGVDFATVN